MVKRTIKETVTEYDKDGNIVRQTVTEITEDDDTRYWPYNPSPLTNPCTPNPWWGEVTCTTTSNNTEGVLDAESRRI